HRPRSIRAGRAAGGRHPHRRTPVRREACPQPAGDARSHRDQAGKAWVLDGPGKGGLYVRPGRGSKSHRQLKLHLTRCAREAPAVIEPTRRGPTYERPAMVPHFDNRIKEVHVTCLSTSSYRYWWWRSSPVLGWLTCSSGTGRATGPAPSRSKPSKRSPRPKRKPRRSCWRPKRKQSRSAPPPNRRLANIGPSRSKSKSAFSRRKRTSIARARTSTAGSV